MRDFEWIFVYSLYRCEKIYQRTSNTISNKRFIKKKKRKPASNII